MSSPDPDTLLGAAPLSVLIVEPTADDRLPSASMLSGAGFQVSVTETFADARARLTAAPPGILITTVRLGLYNGLHLVLRSTASHPDMAVLVTSPTDDQVLRADAEAMGATFIVKPVADAELLAAVLRTIYGRHQRPIRPPFERRAAERRVAAGAWATERRLADRRRGLSALVRGGSAAP